MTPLAFKTLGGVGDDLVMIHGFGSDRLSWAGNVAALLPVARVHALDLPGHGESSSDVGDGSIGQLAARVAETLSSHGIETAHLLGHSLGGAIAVELASEAPGSVRSLSLIAPAGLGGGVDHDFLTRYPDLTTAEDTAALLGRLVTRPQLISRMTVQRVLNQLALPGTREALHRIAGALRDSESALAQKAADLASTGMARLVIWGECDTINPPDAGRLSGFGGSCHVVPDAGHLPHIEAAQLVNAALAEFLAGAAHGQAQA